MKKNRNHVHAIIELFCEHGNDHSYDVVVALSLFTSLQFYIGIFLPIFDVFLSNILSSLIAITQACSAPV